MGNPYGGDTAIDMNSPYGEVPPKREHYLFMVQGRDTGRYYRLQQMTTTIGRKEPADIRLGDQRISSLHCRLTVVGQHVFVEDLGSTNGTFVDDQRVTERTALPVGSTMLVGRTLLRHEFTNAEELKREEDIYVAATTDALTGVANRFSFSQRGQEEISFARRRDTPLCLMIVDADHFKKINDTHGHLAGDRVLRKLGRILGTQKRHEDLLARYGGEEFVYLLRGIERKDAELVAERIRQRVEEAEIAFEGKRIPVTVSIGCCCCRGNAELKLDMLIHAADLALYTAKEQGRNRVRFGDVDMAFDPNGTSFE